jgi:DNA-binding MarR family transcriptional regulator
MASIFDPSIQATDIDSKIAASLERLSQAFRALIWRKHAAGGFSPIQVQVLVHLSFRPAQGRPVGELAKELHVTAATMSDALATLESRQLVARKRRSPDRRLVHVMLTPRGRRAAGRLDDWADAVRESVAGLELAKKPELLRQLLELIGSLQKGGVVSLTRMCFTCRFLEASDGAATGRGFFCKLMEKPLHTGELRLDCPEHELAGT